MRKTLMAAALAIPMALLAVSTFAATPARQPRLFTPNVATRQASQYLADEIFLPASGVTPAPVFATVYYGVCSITCEECYGWCPPEPDTGFRQVCTFACN